MANPIGVINKDTFWVYNGSTWIEFPEFEYFKIKKIQNQINEFEVRVFDISAAMKVYFKEQAEVLFFCGTTMILKGRIQTIEYGDAFEVIARGYGMECKLLDKEYISSGDNRIQFDNTSAKTIVGDINSNILTTTNAGLFATDYGNISMRYEYANRLNALGKTCEVMDYNWWVSHTSANTYSANYLNVNLTQGSTASAKTFNLTSNATSISQSKDISNLVNYVHTLGYGDGINQIHTSVYAASTQSSFLAKNIAATNTTITCSSVTPFNNTGAARIAEEVINYAGKSGTNLTGCTRGVSGSTARAHYKNCYIEQHFLTSSAQTASSIGVHGMMDYTLIDKTIVDLGTLEVIGSGYLSDRKNPIVRISITSDEPLTDAALNIGDNVTVTSSEANVDGIYHIVSQEYNSNYGFLEMTTEVSNRPLEFIEQMNKAKQEAEAMAKYMQGATNIYSLNEVENCDITHPLNLRFFIPNEAVAINKVLLNFKIENFRSNIEETNYWGGETYGVGHKHSLNYGILEETDTENIYEYCDIAPNDAFPVNIRNHSAQQIIIGTYGINEAFNISKISLKLYKDGTPGNLFLKLRNSLTGSDLSTGSFNANSVSETAMPGGWYDINMSPYDLSTSSYVLLISGTSSTANSTMVCENDTNPYPPVSWYSNNTGSTWTEDADYDNLFRIYGNLPTASSIIISAGSEGSEEVIGTYSASQSDLDITNKITSIGVGDWANIEFIPNKRMRIEANAYVQTFLESK